MTAQSGQMLATRIVAVRHGETAWNVENRIQGQLDVGLNARGRWQAEWLALALSDEGIDAIYSSDLSRAVDTARELGRVCNLPVDLDASLRERSFGVFEGLTWAEIEARFPMDSARWRARDPDFAPKGGESLSVFYDRAVAGVGAIARRHVGGCVAVVAYGGVIDSLHRAAMRTDLRTRRSWSLANATVNRLLFADEGFTVVAWGDDSHLLISASAPP